MHLGLGWLRGLSQAWLGCGCLCSSFLSLSSRKSELVPEVLLMAATKAQESKQEHARFSKPKPQKQHNVYLMLLTHASHMTEISVKA